VHYDGWEDVKNVGKKQKENKRSKREYEDVHSPTSYPLIVLQLHVMNVPIYPMYGTSFCSNNIAGWIGGGKVAIGMLAKNLGNSRLAVSVSAKEQAIEPRYGRKEKGG
jgi:hypothetical protein